MAKNKGNKTKGKNFLGLPNDGRLADRLALEQRVRARRDLVQRNAKDVQEKILDQPRFRGLQKGVDFFDLLETTLGNNVSENGLKRKLTLEDLPVLARKAQSLQGRYRGGIKPTQVINASTPIDRRRASTEIPWASPYKSEFNPLTKSLVISFSTAASGKYKEKLHYVQVELLEFNQVTEHFLAPDNPKAQAKLDVQALHNTPIRFNCECGRHTYWYRFIATTGGFAYIGKNPFGRGERGFPKIRNPKLNGVACKHVIRTMKAMLQDKSYADFLAKVCMKQYKVGNSEKAAKTQTTKRDMERSVKAQTKAFNGDDGILSDKEKRINKRLLNRYKQALDNGLLQRHSKDKRTPKQRLATLAKIHNVDKYTDLI